MEPVGVFCGCLLVVIFGSSGFGKLVNVAASRAAAAALGAPAPSVTGTAVPFLEIMVAAALLTEQTSQVGAAAAAALLVAVTALVAHALQQDQRPACHCFGALSTEPVSGRTLYRNLALLGAAFLSWWSPGIDGLARMEGTTRAVAAAGLGGALAALLLHREKRATTRQGHVSQPGATRVRLRSVSGRSLELPDPTRGRPHLLLFLSPGCSPCRRLGPTAARWAQAFVGRLDVSVVAGCEADQARGEGGFSEVDVFLDPDGSAHGVFGAPRRPGAVLVGADGRVTQTAEGETAIRLLLAEALGSAPSDQDAEAPRLDLSASPGPRAAVTVRPLPDGGAVLVDEGTGVAVTVDRLGALLWSVLDGRSTLAEIVTDVAETFRAPEEQVGADVLDLVRSLGAAGMLDGVQPCGDVRGFDLSRTS